MYKGFISWADFLLVPLYFLILFVFIFFIKKNHKDNILYQKYLIKGFVFKMICTVAYCLLIYFYWGVGDSMNYFKNALYIKQLMHSGVENYSLLLKDSDYLKDVYSLDGSSNEPGWIIERMSFLLGYLSFFRFLTTSMLLATLAYSGMFKMFEAFCKLMPEWDNRLAWAVLFFPTVTFYGSGILKDTVCFAAMGWIVYGIVQIFYIKKFRLRYLFMMILAVALIAAIKAYIIAAFMVPFIVYVVMLLVRKIKIIFFRRLFFPAAIVLLVVVYQLNAGAIDNLLGRFAIEKLFDNIKEQQQSYLNSEDFSGGSVFNIGTIEPTVSGFISKMPAGINATLFRPYIWESKNALMLFAGLENLILLLITIWIIAKTGVFRFIKTLFTDPYVFLFLIYTFIFSAIIGLSTANFGTLGRYRIQIIPFYLAGILYVWYLKKTTTPKKQHEKTE